MPVKNIKSRSKHLCHAELCQVEVPPAMLMCKKHWFMVPLGIRNAVWRLYVPGQEITKTPTSAYLKVMREAIEAVAMKEGLR